MEKKYKFVISLGWFCGVAQETERIGLRCKSYPFDWILTDLETVEEMIQTGFEDFLNQDKLFQDQNVKNMYHQTGRECLTYVHDINPYCDFGKEVEKARGKYKRRIQHFMEDICEPCLFIRYICDQLEYDRIQNGETQILDILRRYNQNSDIIFIRNSDINADENQEKIKTFVVEKDEGDSVARKWLEKNQILRELLNGNQYDFDRKENLRIYKHKRFKQKLLKYPNKCKRFIWKLLFLYKKG